MSNYKKMVYMTWVTAAFVLSTNTRNRNVGSWR